MGFNDFASAVTVACGIAIVMGIFGTFIPFVPGLFLCWAGVMMWAILTGGGPGKWFTVTIVTILTAAGWLMKYILPGRKLRRDGVPTRSLMVGGVLGISGLF